MLTLLLVAAYLLSLVAAYFLSGFIAVLIVHKSEPMLVKEDNIRGILILFGPVSLLLVLIFCTSYVLGKYFSFIIRD